jgi:hypothetical protein
VTRNDSYILAKTIVERMENNPFTGNPLKASEAKILFTIGLFFMSSIYDLGKEIVDASNVGTSPTNPESQGDGHNQNPS